MMLFRQVVETSNQTETASSKKQKQNAKSVSSKPAAEKSGSSSAEPAVKDSLKGKGKSSSSSAGNLKQGKTAQKIEAPVRVTRSRAISQTTH